MTGLDNSRYRIIAYVVLGLFFLFAAEIKELLLKDYIGPFAIFIGSVIGFENLMLARKKD